MSPSRPLEAPQLPATVNQVLDEFLQEAKKSLGEDLLSVVLFGSAAEGNLHGTSDVNLVLILSSFEQNKIDSLRGPLRFAQTAIELRPMFILRAEIPQAALAFASKFADILRRRVILYGDDPFVAISISRETRIFELRQQLLNQILRLRASYVSSSLREEQLRLIVVRAIGPLRSAAAGLLEIQGSLASSTQVAFECVGSDLGAPGWAQTLGVLSALQDAPLASPAKTADVFFAVLDLACRLLHRVESLYGEVRRESV